MNHVFVFVVFFIVTGVTVPVLCVHQAEPQLSGCPPAWGEVVAEEVGDPGHQQQAPAAVERRGGGAWRLEEAWRMVLRAASSPAGGPAWSAGGSDAEEHSSEAEEESRSSQALAHYLGLSGEAARSLAVLGTKKLCQV